jgi:hypothetical protein
MPERAGAAQAVDPATALAWQAIALADLATLKYRIARPEIAAHMLPWRPRCPQIVEQCSGCGRTFRRLEERGTHAVAQAIEGRWRCVHSMLGLPKP